MQIRRARENEAGFLSALALRSKAVWGYSAEFLRRCEPLLAVSNGYVRANPVFVAEVDGRIQGFYSLNQSRYEIELDLLFVEPAALRGGIGKALLKHAFHTALDLGHSRLFVESDPDAEPFYLRLGARRIGVIASTVEEHRELPLLQFDLREVIAANDETPTTA